MRRKRVHTLYLPQHDRALSYILNNRDFEILHREGTVCPKEGYIVYYIEYVDRCDTNAAENNVLSLLQLPLLEEDEIDE